MIWYEILGIVIPVLVLLTVVVKNLKWKKIIQNSTMVVEEARLALQDGKITKAEWLKIAATALTAFIPDEE